MSMIDGDSPMSDREPTVEELSELDEPDDFVLFDPEEYDITSNGSDDFSRYNPYEDMYEEDDEDYEQI
jgi:hypothetical protein